MNRFVAGGLAGFAMIALALFLWIRADGQEVPLPDAPPPPEPVEASEEEGLPSADDMAGAVGPAPPEPPEAYRASREERRFNRYDRDRDEIITRLELMSSRTKAFRKLDVDGNNLLTFEEWAVATSDRFAGADGNRDGRLTRNEFRTTRPKRRASRCRC